MLHNSLLISLSFGLFLILYWFRAYLNQKKWFRSLTISVFVCIFSLENWNKKKVIISLSARSKQIPKNWTRWNGPFEENNEIYWKSLRKIRQVRRGQDQKKEQAHSKRDWFLHGYFGKNTSYWAKPKKGDCKVRYQIAFFLLLPILAFSKSFVSFVRF